MRSCHVFAEIDFIPACPKHRAHWLENMEQRPAAHRVPTGALILQPV